jgi:nucleoid-associated protein YgaU
MTVNGALSEAKNLSRRSGSGANCRFRANPSRVAGWGMLVLAMLLLGGCSLPTRGGGETPNEVANEPQFVIVTVTVALSPTARISETRYTVQDGDTLSGIADMFGVTWDAIIQANSLQSQDAIFVGQELVIPAPASPVAGETPTD